MVNRYDTPAEAEFINTYVPIPFEQFITLGDKAKEDVDKALSEYNAALDEFDEFQSPSDVDTQSYYDETYGRFKPVAEKMASNIDMLKTPEGRAEIYSTIYGTDRAKLSKLRQSAEAMKQRQELNQKLLLNNRFDPTWHDVDFTNYNTLDKGIYDDLNPVPYMSIKDLTDPYVDNIKDSYLGTSGGYIYTGVTENDLRKSLNANRTSIFSTPQARKHIEMMLAKNPDLTEDQVKDLFIEQAVTDNQEYTHRNREADPIYLASLKASLAAAKKGKGKDDKEEDEFLEYYNQMGFAANKASVFNQGKPEFLAGFTNDVAYNEYHNAAEDLRKGFIIYNNGGMSLDEYNKLFANFNNKQAKINNSKGITNYTRAKLNSDYGIFVGDYYNNDGTLNRVSSKNVGDNKMFDSSHRLNWNSMESKDLVKKFDEASINYLNDISVDFGNTTDYYNRTMSSGEYQAQIGNNVNYTTMYARPSTKGLIVPSEVVSKMADIATPLHNIKINGKDKTISEAIKDGTFKDISVVPQGKVIQMTVDGESKPCQIVDVYIPKQENRVFSGQGATVTVKRKPENTNDKTTNRDYYVITCVEPLNTNEVVRNKSAQSFLKDLGSSTMQNDQYPNTTYPQIFGDDY